MITKTKHELCGKTAIGIFDLRCMLSDYTSEEHVNHIVVRASALYDQYIRREKRNFFTPICEVHQDGDGRMRIALVLPSSHQIFAEILLRVKREQVVLYSPRRGAEGGKKLNAVQLRIEMHQHMSDLPLAEVAQLEHWMDFFYGRSDAVYEFDFECLADSITVVAFAGAKRASVLTLFYPQ